MEKKIVRVTIDGIDQTGKLSDGYHTFDELYDHRITLFIALCRTLSTFKEVIEIKAGEFPTLRAGMRGAWRSRRHSDGELCFGTGTQFVMGIGKAAGQQITYHIPVDRWEEIAFAETLEVAPQWDGHSSDKVLNRLKAL